MWVWHEEHVGDHYEHVGSTVITNKWVIITITWVMGLAEEDIRCSN